MGFSDGYQRYDTEISDLFSAENKLHIQMEIEIQLAKVQEELGMIPQGIAKKIDKAKSFVTLQRVKEIEKEIHHDVMAMVKGLAEQAGEAGQYVHFTATSMDIQDSVLAIQMTNAKKLILIEGKNVCDNLLRLMHKYQSLTCVGRTHGQFAVPTTVGFKFANYLFEISNSLKKFKQNKVNVTKFSGAVGNYASSMSMEMERRICEKLNLEPIPISTQVVTRTIISEFMYRTAELGAVIERIAKEIRHLQRSEIGEWYESRSKNQVGSSAMPHKRNPHKSERLNGLARVLRANISVSLENIALEHERDLTNSAPERLIIPENLVLLHYMLNQLSTILSNLEINENMIHKNLLEATEIHSEQILKKLVSLVGRQKGHEMLQKHVSSKNFRESVLNDKDICLLIDVTELENTFEEFNTGLAIEKVHEIAKLYKSINLTN